MIAVRLATGPDLGVTTASLASSFLFATIATLGLPNDVIPFLTGRPGQDQASVRSVLGIVRLTSIMLVLVVRPTLCCATVGPARCGPLAAGGALRVVVVGMGMIVDSSLIARRATVRGHAKVALRS